MTTEEKLALCVETLLLMCKPAKLCSEEELAYIDQFPCGEEQMAYETLVKIGVNPMWKGVKPITNVGPGPHFFYIDIDQPPNLTLVKGFKND